MADIHAPQVPDAELTDLEGATLVNIARASPTTAYAVAKQFADSPSEFWSGSAGAVYPLIKRMQARGLINSTEGADGKRARSDLSLTAAGTAAMRTWLLDAKRAAGLGFDPLRTRAVHLDLVSAEEREAFLDAVGRHIADAARVPVWSDSPRLQAIHASVMNARKTWFKALQTLLRQDP
jgi:DNA-binding PadR family transcriptional regulator